MISSQIEEFQKASAGMTRIRELLEARPELRDGAGAVFPAGPLTMEFDSVSFGYGEPDMVVHDLTFQVAPGEVLGLLGRTGSGKTTIARLLFRLYDPAAGAVRLGGVDLREARLADARAQLGMVTQDVQLFRASLRDSVTFFDPQVDDRQIVEGLAGLGLMEWDEALPDGPDTVLGSGGGVSAGEAQLLDSDPTDEAGDAGDAAEPGSPELVGRL